jgi:peroxiredoxin
MDGKQLPIPDPEARKTRTLAGRKPLTESRIERNGLRPGTLAPDFTLPELYGRPISIEQYRGRRLILVFSDPHCGPCNELAPYLARAYQRCQADSTEIVVVTRGDVEENRQKAEAHGFEFPVVVQDRWKLSKKYGIFATPAAFLIGEDGRTEGEVAVGFQQIRNILRQEFASNPIERFKETFGDISGVLSSPMPRRRAFRLAACMVAGALLAAVGIPETALAACGSGSTACGTACCDNNTQKCCNAATNTCCANSLVCCSGKCCAPGQTCKLGQCQQQALP